MEGDASWSDDELDSSGKGTGVFHPYLEFIDADNTESSTISIDVLPVDLQERILASLPLACIFKACCVSKKWKEIVHSTDFKLKDASMLSQRPWYFMFTSSDEPSGCFYDSILREWHDFELPFFVKDTWIIAPSSGLVCFMDDDESSSQLYVCNPITRNYKKLEKPPVPRFSVYSALAFSVDRASHKYTAIVVRSGQASDNYVHWDVSIHIIYSDTMAWLPPVVGTLDGWRAGNDSVICNGVLYFLVYSTRTGGVPNTHGLLTYNLDRLNSNCNLIDSIILVPCPLTCGRLMNLHDKLVLVGGIGRQHSQGIIKGISIWVLKGRGWEEVSRMPHKFFQGFGELDDVFASSGTGDLIFIQSYGATVLCVFDMNLKVWNWSPKSPMTKKFPLQLYSGFCFEPQLKISS